MTLAQGSWGQMVLDVRYGALICPWWNWIERRTEEGHIPG